MPSTKPAKKSAHGNRQEIYSELAAMPPQKADPIVELKRELHAREAELKKQQIQFAKLMASGQHNQTEAARLAGYSDRSAYLQGHRLMRNAKVVSVLRIYEQIDNLINGIPKHLKRFEAKQILQNSKTRDADKLAALTYLSRLDGDFEENGGGNSQIIVHLNLAGAEGQVINANADVPQIGTDHSYKGGSSRGVPTELLGD